jgi:hypothetical protein
MGFEDQMADFDDQFDADKEAGTLPDGTYSPARVIEARVEQQEDDSYNMVWKFEAVYDDEAGNEITGSIRKWWNDITGTDEKAINGRKYLAKDMKRVGYEGRASGLLQACENEDFIGLECEIVVKTKPGDTRDYTNVYINRLSPGSASASGEPVAAGAAVGADDDIPF